MFARQFPVAHNVKKSWKVIEDVKLESFPVDCRREMKLTRSLEKLCQFREFIARRKVSKLENIFIPVENRYKRRLSDYKKSHFESIMLMFHLLNPPCLALLQPTSSF